MKTEDLEALLIERAMRPGLSKEAAKQAAATRDIMTVMLRYSDDPARLASIVAMALSFLAAKGPKEGRARVIELISEHALKMIEAFDKDVANGWEPPV